MNLSEVLNQLVPDIGRSIRGFAPEVVLVAAIVLLLVWRVLQSRHTNLSGIAMIGVLAALILAIVQLISLGSGDSSLGEGTPITSVAKLVRTNPPLVIPFLRVDESGKQVPLIDVSSVPAKSGGAAPIDKLERQLPAPKHTREFVKLEDLPQAVRQTFESEGRGKQPDRISRVVNSVTETTTYQFEELVHGPDQPRDLFRGAVPASPGQPQKTNGLLRFDGFTVFFRIFLLLFAALVIWLTAMTGIPDAEDSPDFYTLLLGATLGMSLMASANHLLMIYIAVEMASLPSYAMAGFLKGRRDASEASLKYVVYGAGASGMMLYGISLLVGKYGTAHLPTLAVRIASDWPMLNEPAPGAMSGVLLLGLMLVLVGIAFKIAAVPFHFWCPDVFEGAAAEVAGFLSVASKAAALALLARITVVLTANSTILQTVNRPPVDLYWGGAIALLAAMTATYGNLAAYAQTNLKRLLAYSTIAHAGYMMMPIAAAVVQAQRGGASQAQPALESMAFYLIIYLFMNLGAFAVVALIRNEVRSEDLNDWGGIIRRAPFLTIAMGVFLLSLTGLPPLAGFAAKFRIFAVLFEAELYWLLVVGLANTVFSLFYYVKVLRVMVIDAPVETGPAWPVRGSVVAFCSLLILANLAVMLVWKTWDAMDGLTALAVQNLIEALPSDLLTLAK